jgi:hypothetical protein
MLCLFVLLSFTARRPSPRAKSVGISVFRGIRRHSADRKDGKRLNSNEKSEECLDAAGDDSPATVGKCCTRFPDEEDCSEIIVDCEKFYGVEGAFEKGSEDDLWYGEGCPAYCSAMGTPPKWCPQSAPTGLSGGAIAGIVVGSVAGVGGGVALAVWLILRRKKTVTGAT